MNKLLLTLMAAGAGVAGMLLLYHRTEKFNATTAMVDGRWRSATNDLGTTQAAAAALREEIQEKLERLRQANRHPNLSPELLKLLDRLEGSPAPGQARAWAELRQQLQIGWEASPDYVLVNKHTIHDVWFNKLNWDGSLSDDAAVLLSLSPEEQKAVRTALAAACAGQWLNATSTSPGGDVVAQYTITPPDPAFTAGQSNAFGADITEAIGPERAGFFLPDAWRELVSNLAPAEAQTMTLRRTTVDGQPDLVCEVTQGAEVSTMPVRYACYPNFPVMKLFPGGWQTMAQTLGFELPPGFMPTNTQQ